MASITVRDEAITKIVRPLEFTLTVPTTHLTVREIIRSRVYGEVNDYNLNQSEYFHGLVQPTDAEATLNGFRLRRGHVIDPLEQYEQALTAFGQNGFLLLVNDRQVDQLDEVVEVGEHTVITFLKLVPLVGG
jgi:hypothetical protein